MDCPVCKVAMMVVEYDGVELDYCVECRGIWFDRNEMEWLLLKGGLRIEDLDMKASTRTQAKTAGETERRCPLCRRRMKKMSVGAEPPVIVDRCARHGGYWFDGGELHAVMRAGLPAGEWEKVALFLNEMFPEP